MTKACAVIHYGDIVGVSTDGTAFASSLSPTGKSHRMIRLHSNNRGVILMGEYKMPVIVSNAELKEESRLSGPTLVQKKPEIGDRVAYYPGNGDYAFRWAIEPPRKQFFYSQKAAAS